jgi:hypothetical protein
VTDEGIFSLSIAKGDKKKQGNALLNQSTFFAGLPPRGHAPLESHVELPPHLNSTLHTKNSTLQGLLNQP